MSSLGEGLSDALTMGRGGPGGVYQSLVSTTSPMTDQALPAITPSVLAILLAAGVFLTQAWRSLEMAGSAPAWMGIWAAAAVIAFAASFRHALPALPGRLGGVSWLLAGATGGALVGRHALDGLLQAWAQLSADEATLPGLDLGDLVLLVALATPALIHGLASRLRAPRPALLLPGLLALVAMAVVLVPFLAHMAPQRRGSLPSFDLDAPGVLIVPAVLLWATTLVGPAAMPLSSRRAIAHHWAPRVLGALTLVALPAVLLAVGGPRGLEAGRAVQLSVPGARLFGPYGAEIGAGIECLVALVAAHVLILLCCRIAARSLPGLRSGIFVVVAVAAGLCSAWMSLHLLLVSALATGWVAVLWGTEPEGAAPPPLVDV